MKLLWCLTALVLASLSLPAASDPDAWKDELVKVETDFCARAAKDGIPTGFLAHIAPEGVLLVAGFEVRGRAGVTQEFARLKPGTTLTWKPIVVDVSASGDLGYTAGNYELSVLGENGAAPSVRVGHYVTIWKRQADGNWKFVLDGGTPGQPKK